MPIAYKSYIIQSESHVHLNYILIAQTNERKLIKKGGVHVVLISKILIKTYLHRGKRCHAQAFVSALAAFVPYAKVVDLTASTNPSIARNVMEGNVVNVVLKHGHDRYGVVGWSKYPSLLFARDVASVLRRMRRLSNRL